MPESSSSSTSSCSSCSSAAPPVVDLDIEGVAEEKEGEVGGLVVRRHDNNEAHRKEIDLITTAVAGNVTLDVTVTTPSGPNVVPAEIKVFDAREDGNEIEFDGTKNKFPVGELPKLLYVQGHQGSNTMRDVTLKLTHDQTGSFASVNFTVLWVKMTSNHSDDVSVGNSRRELYREMGVPQVGYALGEGRLIATVGVPSLAEEQVGLSAYSEGMTRGSELVGTLSPSDFKPSEFGGRMTMLRAYLYAWVYKGASGHEQILGFDGAWDNSPDVMRDDDPQSRPDPESTAAPPGTIYDFDTPGVPAIGMPNGFDPIATDDIIRFRVNFHEFAAYIAPGSAGERCSWFHPWHTKQSYKLDGDEWTSGTIGFVTKDSIVVAGNPWAQDEWVPGIILAKEQLRRITTNDDNSITVTPDFDAPYPTGDFVVVTNHAWVEDNSVANDNSNGPGIAKMSWDLKAPTVTAITPNIGATGASVNVEFTGTSFASKSDASVQLTKTGEDPISGTGLSQESVTKLEATFSLAGAAIGNWDVVVTNCDGSTGTLAEGFEVTN